MKDQNPVSLLRSITGLTQKDLALRAHTSQSTIAFYESGAKSPTISTLQRLAAELGLEVSIRYVSPLTREDRRSLAYHRGIAKLLVENQELVLFKAIKVLEKMRRLHPHAKSLLDRWRLWLELPMNELIANMLDVGMEARDMRQVTPFAGVLTAQERLRILKKLREEEL